MIDAGQPERRDVVLPRWLPGVVLAIAGVALVGHALLYNFVCDDAYISFRYSYNFAVHNELTFNVGDRVEGYTNFLWTVLLGLLLKLGLRPEVMALVLGAGFGVAVVVLLYLLGRIYRGGRPTGWELVGPLLLPAWASFAVWSSGGLETQMFCALALGGITLYVHEHARADHPGRAGRARRRWSGVVFALAAMTRPEGVLLFGLTGLHRAAANLLGERRVLPTWAEVAWVLGFVVPFGAYFIWRYSYYGYPFPNTYYVKSGGAGLPMATKWGLPYLWDFVHHNRLYALAPLLVLFRPRRDPSRADPLPAAHGPAGVRPAFLWSYVLLVALVYTGYIVWVGGDFMTMGRFFVPLLPLWALFAQEGLRETVERFPRLSRPSAWRPRRMVVAASVLVGGAAVNSVWLYQQNQKLSYYRWGLDTVAYLKKFADDRIIIGTWMRNNFPPDTLVTLGGVGASAYASRLPALDALGLADRYIAHEVPGRAGRPGHAKFAPEHYVLKRKPDLICHIGKHQDWPYRPPAGEAALWRRRGYRWVCLDPGGVRPRYYCCLKRIDRDLGPYLIEVDP